jgi:CDP-glucose 4,6-dehydratase
MRAICRGEEVIIRSPHSTRPWQHVLEPLGGYLLLGQQLLAGRKEYAEAWNFGPSDEGAIAVCEVIGAINEFWPKVRYRTHFDDHNPHEANLLKLDCSKAHMRLKWKGLWNSRKTFEQTALWYREYYENNEVISEKQLKEYSDDIVKYAAWN